MEINYDVIYNGPEPLPPGNYRAVVEGKMGKTILLRIVDDEEEND